MTAKKRKPKSQGHAAAEAVRSPQDMDIHVGKRIRMRRALLGVSQEKLAESIGITFQQVQKYERGSNRVSASRLFQIGQVLDVPVSYFYADYSGAREKTAAIGLSDTAQETLAATDDNILYSKETADLLRAYYSLEDESKRRELLKIIKSMIDSMR